MLGLAYYSDICENKGLGDLVEKIREKILEVELNRGEKRPLQQVATSIQSQTPATLFPHFGQR